METYQLGGALHGYPPISYKKREISEKELVTANGLVDGVKDWP